MRQDSCFESDMRLSLTHIMQIQCPDYDVVKRNSSNVHLHLHVNQWLKYFVAEDAIFVCRGMIHISKKEKQIKEIFNWQFTFKLNCHGTCIIMQKNRQRCLIPEINWHQNNEWSNICNQLLTNITLVYNWSNPPAMSKNASLAKLSCKK